MGNTGLAEDPLAFIKGNHGSMRHQQRRLIYLSKKVEDGDDIGAQAKSKKGDPRNKFPGRVKKII